MTPPKSGDAPAAPGLRELSPEEVDAFLRAHEWGVLSVVHEGRPYAVPVAYGYEDGVFYFATGPGRKADALRAHPVACLTVSDVRDGDHWTSVVATGRVEWVDAEPDRLAAERAIFRQRRAAGEVSQRDARRFAGALIARLVADEVTGRERR